MKTIIFKQVTLTLEICDFLIYLYWQKERPNDWFENKYYWKDD